MKRKPLPDTDQMSSRPPSSVSNMSESVKENLEDLESRISPLGSDIKTDKNFEFQRSASMV